MPTMQLSFEFDDMVPIPECGELLELHNYLMKDPAKKIETPAELANEMVRELKLWQEKNPGRDVIDIVPPNWKEYIKNRLKNI